MEKISKLESIVFNTSLAYGNSTAFANALSFVKKNDIKYYYELLCKEAEEIGLIDLIEE